MKSTRTLLSIYIISKNEEDNIEKILCSLAPSGIKLFLIDSGSTDKTLSIAKNYKNLEVIHHTYTSHCETYNLILESAETKYVIILDADTVVSFEGIDQLLEQMENTQIDALISPVNFFVESRPLAFGSLYPPKPFLFRTGSSLFERIGHAERLRDSVQAVRIDFAALKHDDRKPYTRFLESQIRYHKKIEESLQSRHYSWRDWIRIKTPLFGFISFIYVLFFRFGFLSGKAGMIYALDRLIAESIIHRQSLADKLINRK